MARSAQAPVAQSNIKWHEATFEVDGKSVRVQYLSDRELNNSQIADLVARGQDYGRAWVDDRAQGSAARIEKAAEMVREAGAPTETGVARRATQAEMDRFAGRRTIEAAGSAARQVGEWAVETAERVGTAIGIPVPTERTRRERQQRASGGSRARVVHAMDEISLDAPAEETAAPAEEAAPKAEERKAPGREETTTIPQSDLRGNTYEFRISYDPSKLEPGYTEADLRSVKFFEKPENRDAVINFSFRNVSVRGDWNEELGNPLFHRVYSRLFEIVDFVLVNPENNKVAQHFAVYIDREKAEQLGIDTSDPLALIRSGVILRVMQGAIGNETRWRRGSTEDVIAAWAEFIKTQREENGSEMRVGRT